MSEHTMKQRKAMQSEAKPQQDDKGRFVSGNIGGGRKKGSRNRLGEDFLKALHDDFKEHGVEAIQQVRSEKPDAYIKVIASILPKELDLNVNRYDDISDDQLRREFINAIAEARALGIDIGTGGVEGADQAGAGEPAKATVPGHGTA